MTQPLIHLASRLYGTPLLIARPKLEVILAVLGSRIGLPEAATAVPAPMSRTAAPALPGIAVIPIHGTLVRRTLELEAHSGLTSYAEIGARLDAALRDPEVSGILLDLDSPGGESGGVFELAAKIRAGTSHKPIWAHANDTAFSAAYAIAAGASRVTLAQTGGAGSIGVIALHVDQSVKDAREGLTYSALYAGHHKNDLNPHAPLSPQAAAALQAEVDRLYGIFVAQVAGFRGLPETAVRATEAGLFFGEDAVSAGLADGVLGFDAVLNKFADAIRTRQRLISPQARKAAVMSPLPVSLLHSESVMHDHAPGPLDDEAADESRKDADAAGNLTPHAAPSPQNDLAAATPVIGEPTAQSLATEAHHAGRSEAQAIAELCLIAGAAPRTAEFLAAGLSEAQVRRVLLAARAETPEIASRIQVDAGTSVRPEASPVVAAVQKLIARS
ncbi:S49 family peptidase [Methylococcus capsulatus]|jgi:signal peptide peptidase SppA|uniref:Capsid assembly protease n=1 Tax=Methylococcus capsulatus TaxID=414 RepID=A0AA35UVA7_METCP|nr:S49 family peptidase [Methylococcus capsulatus]QXP89566.1 S49 family peptidase [Methylococcus capsulatus]CAI8819075.1 capsid assembly protease [Methylococcus capsulatus]